MSSQIDPTPVHPVHPVLACAAAIASSLQDVEQVNVGFMGTTEKRAALLELAGIESRLASLRMRLLAVADDVALEEGARDVAAVLSTHTRGDGHGLRRELRLAQALDQRWLKVAAALAGAEVNTAQAVVITRALDDLPTTDLPADIVAAAEAHLVAEAAHYGPTELRILGRKILEVIAPDLFEQAEGRRLEAEERRARERTSLTSKRLGDGTTRIAINVPDVVAARLRSYLEAFTSPRHDPAGPLDGPREGDRVPAHRKLGQAFCAFLEAADPRRLPVHGGDATTLLVTVSLDALRNELAAAGIGDSERLTAAEARRLACTAQIVPVVLGGKSEVLDLGRSSRLFKPAQRKAMIIRDRRCRAEGCTIPAAWCEAHHARDPWATGGRTDLADGVLLCSWHHHRAHDNRYQTNRMTNGDIRFNKRT